MLRSRLKLEEGWTSFLLLTFMLLCVVWSVRAAEWTEGLSILQWIAIAAILTGVFLAQRRRIPAPVAHLLCLACGAIWVTAMLSSIFSPPMVPAGLVMPGQGLLAKPRIMYQEVMQWFLDPGEAEAWLSNFVFVLTLAVLTWLMCYASTWFVFRTHWAWGAVVPAGAACLLNIYYAPPRLTLYFILYCLCALLLVVRTHVYVRQRAWRQGAVNFNLDVDLTFIRDGALVSLLAVFLAWTIPTAMASPRLADFWVNFQEPWHDVQTQWNRLFASLNYQGQSSLVSFGRSLTLSGAVNLRNVPVLEVQAPSPHYWRAVSYDEYTGSGWVNTDDLLLVLQPDDARIKPAPFMMQQEFTQTVRMLEAGEDHLFFAGQFLRSSLFARARLANATLSEERAAAGVSMLYGLKTLRRNQSYTIVSFVSAAAANQLRAAGTDYPLWVTTRYLQLPPSVPARVSLLSREVVGNASTPYDQAAAIQDYLRRMTYDQLIRPPPAGRDVVDWFLFENRKGYCDYYATAMAVMCRSLGIPARVSQGYAPGEYVSTSRSYRVYQSSAHAWPEVYFSGYGWIEFEPTPSQPVLSRPEDLLLPVLAGLGQEPPTERTDAEEKYGPNESLIEGEDRTDVTLARAKLWYTRYLPSVLALAGALFAALGTFVGWWCLSLRGLSPAARIYEQMRRLGSLLGVAQALYQTPVEYGASLSRVLAQGQEDMGRVVALYVKQRFSRRGLSDKEEAELHKRWRMLRLQMVRQALKPKLRKRRPSRSFWASPSTLRPRSPLE